MSHGNLSPRQKMINLMYLVLMALLALNVSAEVLNAFVLVNDSLNKTEDVIRAKNEAILAEFANKYEANPERVQEWKDRADNVKKSADELADYINSLQEEIVAGSGEDLEAYKEHGTVAIDKKDGRDFAMLLLKEQGKALELKSKIEDYRSELLKIYEETNAGESSLEGVRQNLNTDPVVGQDGSSLSWDIANFDQLPIVAVLTMLSKVKNDVLNSEADMIAYLYNNIDAGAFKFNKLDAFVYPYTSDYVLQGEPYKAGIFIAASDTTQEPEIILADGTKLDVNPETGHGEFTGATGSPGVRKIEGIIKVLRPGTTDDYIEYPFSHEYQVAIPSVSISPTKMNVFYRGVDNPVDIVAAGIPADQISASMEGGTLRPLGGGKYIARPAGGGRSVIRVSAGGRGLGSMEFRVRNVPDPSAVIGTGANKKGGPMPKNTLLAIPNIRAELEDFDFDLRFDIIGFAVTVNIGGFDETATSNSGNFTQQQKNIIRQANRGSRVIIENVRGRGPDGAPRRLNDIVLVLQ